MIIESLAAICEHNTTATPQPPYSVSPFHRTDVPPANEAMTAMKHGLALLSFVSSRSATLGHHRLAFAVRTLEATHYDGRVFIVDDSSDDAHQVELLTSLSCRYDVIRRPANGGIGRAKNTCIRVLMEAGVDVGFIAEDDIHFAPGWYDAYLEAHRQTDIHHFSWAWEDDPHSTMLKTPVSVNNYPVAATSRLNGLFLSFTRTVVATVGGFKVLPRPWGHEHTNWTMRILRAGLAPFFADVLHSNRFIRMGPYAADSAFANDLKSRWAKENEAAAFDLSRSYIPLLE